MNELERPEKKKKEHHIRVLQKLHDWEKSAEDGYKMDKNTDRLTAALHLLHAWREVKAIGFSLEEFQNAVLIRLKRQHARRKHFKLANWILPAATGEITAEIIQRYKSKSEPQKALEPYLVGITVAAEFCGANPDDWKLKMMNQLSFFNRPNSTGTSQETDDRPAETLSLMLNKLCKAIADKNELGTVFASIRSTGCRWEMFDEKLVTTDKPCMERFDSPISPVNQIALYFEEMFPFPSIELVRIPYLVEDKVKLMLAPDELLRESDEDYLSKGEYADIGFPMKESVSIKHYSIPENAKELVRATGQLIFYRQIRLAIVQDGFGKFCAAFESRPYVELRFDTASQFAGSHYVKYAYEPDILRGLYYARTAMGGGVWPTITGQDDHEWRIRYSDDLSLENSAWLRQVRETDDWQFEFDPIGSPEGMAAEPSYLSYTPVTPDYVKYWLKQDFLLGSEKSVCPWERHKMGFNESSSRYDKDLPPIHQLNFPDDSHASSIERCLHNGLIEESLQAAISQLSRQTDELQTQWIADRDVHTQRLLDRWNKNYKVEE